MGSTVTKNIEDKELGSADSPSREKSTSLTIFPVASRSAKVAKLSRMKQSDSEPVSTARLSAYDLMMDEPPAMVISLATGFEHYSFYREQDVAQVPAPVIAELPVERIAGEDEGETPYIVGEWVINTIPCIIRGVDDSSPIICIRYPRGTKTRFFTYQNDELIRVETVLGEDDKDKTRVVYTKCFASGAWFMSLDGITSRLPGEISLSETGVFHVQVDDTGRCRREYPDGNTSVDMACGLHQKGTHALLRALISDESEQSANNRSVLDLLSVVSHDLRSPLTSVQGLLTLLSAGAFGDIPDKARERIAGVEADLTRLTRLINELLDAEMLVSGKLVMRKQLVDVQELFDAAVGSLSGLAMQQKVQLSVVKSNLQLGADKDRLVRVLVNIVANAIKYSPKGSTVVLSAEFDGSRVILKVKDCGRGIPAKYQRAIFERFQQVNECDWSERGGVGLGLAISKSIVEAHGGTIGVESQMNAGSTFWVALPANTLYGA